MTSSPTAGQPSPSLPPTVEQIKEALLRTTELRVGSQTGIPAHAMPKLASGLAKAIHALYPTCQPSREALIAALDPWVVTHHHGCHEPVDEDWGSSLSTREAPELADAVLASLPGRSEAEVKAEALREVVSWIDHHTSGWFCDMYTGARACIGLIEGLADRLAGGESLPAPDLFEAMGLPTVEFPEIGGESR